MGTFLLEFPTQTPYIEDGEQTRKCNVRRCFHRPMYLLAGCMAGHMGNTSADSVDFVYERFCR